MNTTLKAWGGGGGGEWKCKTESSRREKAKVWKRMDCTSDYKKKNLREKGNWKRVMEDPFYDCGNLDLDLWPLNQHYVDNQ